MIKVKIWQDNYYPCGYQLKAVRKDITKLILATARENGSPYPEDAAATSRDDEIVTADRHRTGLDRPV